MKYWLLHAGIRAEFYVAALDWNRVRRMIAKSNFEDNPESNGKGSFRLTLLEEEEWPLDTDQAGIYRPNGAAYYLPEIGEPW